MISNLVLAPKISIYKSVSVQIFKQNLFISKEIVQITLCKIFIVYDESF